MCMHKLILANMNGEQHFFGNHSYKENSLGFHSCQLARTKQSCGYVPQLPTHAERPIGQSHCSCSEETEESTFCHIFCRLNTIHIILIIWNGVLLSCRILLGFSLGDLERGRRYNIFDRLGLLGIVGGVLQSCFPGICMPLLGKLQR